MCFCAFCICSSVGLTFTLLQALAKALGICSIAAGLFVPHAALLVKGRGCFA